MNSPSIVSVVADSIGVGAAGAPTQPTAAQAARFEQQLYQRPSDEAAHYGAPPAGIGSDFHAVADFAREASTRLKVNLQSSAPELDVQGLPPELQQELRLQQQFSEGIRNMSKATLGFELIGKSIELAENMPKVLYQQG
ncbi:MAG TPA: hypothetical protein VI653_12225 [Steroidobacteraceae bacterium]